MRLPVTAEQMERLIAAVGGETGNYLGSRMYPTAEQMERLIAAFGGETGDYLGSRMYPTAEQMERLIAAVGGETGNYLGSRMHPTAEQMERLIEAVGGETGNYLGSRMRPTAEQMERLIEAAQGPSVETLSVTGISPLLLVNAIAHSMVSLTQYGKCTQPPVDYLASVTQTGVCEQESGAAPATPKAIKCNNGTIKVSRNLCDVKSANISVGKYIDNSGTTRNDTANFYYTPYIAVDSSKTYTMHTSAALAYFSIMEYDSSQAFLSRDLFGSSSVAAGDEITFTLSQDCAFIRFGSNMKKANISESDVLAVNWMLTETADALPYRPYKEIYYDGTPETITDAFGNTATAPPLLGVGSYADTLEFLAGALGRQVGVRVLDGTGTWVKGGTQNQLYSDDVFTDRLIDGRDCFCTHFVSTTTTSDLATAGYVLFGATTQRINVSSVGFADVAEWTAWLAAQFRAGTPVIVVYSLATATTETVTGQMLVKAPLTVTAEVTVPTLATTTAAVSTPDPFHPLPVWCNNGRLEYGQYGKNLYNPSSPYAIAKPCVIGTNSSSFPNAGQTWANSLTFFVPCKPNTKYTYSCATKGDRLSIFGLNNVIDPTQYTEDSSLVFDSKFVSSGSSAPSQNNYTITTGANTKMLAVYCALNTRPTNIQLEEGDTATSYESYHFGLHTDGTPEVLTVEGKNLFTGTIEQGNISSSTGENTNATTRCRTQSRLPVKPSTEYTISCVIDGFTSGSSKGIFVYQYLSDGTWITSGWKDPSGYAFTTNALTESIRVVFAFANSGTPTTPDMISKVQLEYGDTATTYQPYSAPQTASVVDLLGLTDDYRDTHELVHGPVTRDVGFMAVDGYEGDWVKATSGSNVMFYRDSNLSAAANVSASGDIILCAIATHYKNSWTSGSNKIVQRSNKNFGFMNPTGFTVDSTVEDWENYCKAHPFLVFYPLATEGTEQATPQHLSTVAGTNVVSVTAEVSGITLEAQYKGVAA